MAQMRFLEHHEPSQALALCRLHPKVGPNVEGGRGWREALHSSGANPAFGASRPANGE